MGMDTPSSVSHPTPAAVEEGNQEMKRRQPNPGSLPLHRPIRPCLPLHRSLSTACLGTERGGYSWYYIAHSKSVRSCHIRPPYYLSFSSPAEFIVCWDSNNPVEPSA